MKKFLLFLLTFLVAFCILGLNPASAWRIDEYTRITPDGGYEPDSDSTDVWFDITNDSAENMIGFGAGTALDPEALELNEPPYYYIEYKQPRETHGSSIGNWWVYIVTEEQWDDNFTDFYGPGGDTTYKGYFGLSWAEAFGVYENAFVAIPDFHNSPGAIEAGTTYQGSNPGDVDNLDFGFWYFLAYEGFSPAIALFDQSGVILGETNINNPNPSGPTPGIPEPSTIFLIGMGLLGISRFSRKK